MTKRITILIFSALITGSSLAQSNCVQSLDRAKTLFAEGHLYDIPTVLEECLKRGFSREQRIQAFHLLSMTYLYLDQPEEAEDAYLKLLALEPEFDVEKDNDKIEIVYLNSKFKTTPIFTFTVRAGLNRTMPVIINDYDLNQSDPEEYGNRTGYWFGPGIDLSINKRWKVGAELLYRRTSFYYNNQRFNEDQLELTQVQNWVSLPVSVKYIRKTGQLQSYVYAGVMYDFLVSSAGEFEYIDISPTEGQNVQETSTESENVNITDLRNRVSLNVLGGIGVKYRIDYYYIFFELRFVGGLRNLVNGNNRYNYSEDNYLYDFSTMFKYTYVDDDFRLNTFGFSVGFENPFYKPRRIGPKQPFYKRIFNKN